jgi:hypothetical protein
MLEYRPVSRKLYRRMIRIFLKLRHVGLRLQCSQVGEIMSLETVINLLRKRRDKDNAVNFQIIEHRWALIS